MALIVNKFDVDFDLDFLRDAVAALDRQLDRLDELIGDLPDDAFELCWRANHIYGLGFVACQNYLAETISLFGADREKALNAEPIHLRSGVPIAALTNSAANFWKHRSEWPSPPPATKRPVQHLVALGVDASADFPLANAFVQLVHPHQPRFLSLVPFLQRWRDALRKQVGR